MTRTTRVVLTNNLTGNLEITASDTSGNRFPHFVASILVSTNATFTVNGGPLQTSTSNTLSSAALGVTGLSVTANTTGTQTIQVAPNTSPIATAIQSFITNFNQLQTRHHRRHLHQHERRQRHRLDPVEQIHEVGDWATSSSPRPSPPAAASQRVD